MISSKYKIDLIFYNIPISSALTLVSTSRSQNQYIFFDTRRLTIREINIYIQITLPYSGIASSLFNS